MSIEKEVIAFFKNLLKEFEENIEVSGDQTAGKFRSAIGSESSEKRRAFRYGLFIVGKDTLWKR
jgi:hypothetical protein